MTRAQRRELKRKTETLRQRLRLVDGKVLSPRELHEVNKARAVLAECETALNGGA
jgi:hypothetical protein